MIEKRVMMKFIQSCMKENDFEDFYPLERLESISFYEFIHSQKFSTSITNYLLNGVAMCSAQKQTALQVYSSKCILRLICLIS